MTDESYDSLEESFHALEEKVATLVADVHDLALYTKLNITGFMKILKVGCCSYEPSFIADFDHGFVETRCKFTPVGAAS